MRAINPFGRERPTRKQAKKKPNVPDPRVIEQIAMKHAELKLKKRKEIASKENKKFAKKYRKKLKHERERRRKLRRKLKCKRIKLNNLPDVPEP